MARVRLTFRQRDVTAAIRAVEAAGYVIKRVEIERDGRIVIVPVNRRNAELQLDQPELNEWDEVFNESSASIR
jgi:hypothetical protein